MVRVLSDLSRSRPTDSASTVAHHRYQSLRPLPIRVPPSRRPLRPFRRRHRYVSPHLSIHFPPTHPYLSLSKAGQDATQTFFSLHAHEVLAKPQYARLQIGYIPNEDQQFAPPEPGVLSKIPYAEPTWLRDDEGFSSPYFKEVGGRNTSRW